MSKYYHFTSMNNFFSIMKKGLIPNSGFRSYSIQEKNKGVFLSKGITRSIQMYSHTLNYYLKCIGSECYKELQNCWNDLNSVDPHLPNSLKEIFIKECKCDIKRITDIRNCSNFFEYLGGPPCLLSIEGINVDDESMPDNCCYFNIISPENIKIVALKDNRTNNVIYDLEAILSYYMNFFTLNDYDENSLDDVRKLYDYRNYPNCAIFKPDDYEVLEIPITNFDYEYQYKKTLT